MPPRKSEEEPPYEGAPGRTRRESIHVPLLNGFVRTVHVYRVVNVGTDPNLGVLADNGGPTLTHAIFPGSVALNAGYASGGVTQDQRGLNRTYGSGPDIGAYEWAPTSNFSLAVLNGSRSQSTSITGDTHVTVIRNADGDLVAMTGNGSVWIAQRIRDYTPAPAVTSDPVVWTDPHDGLVYVAAPSAEGFILHRRAADGTWTFRNLSTEFSVSNADSPQGVLTFFVSRPRTGDALVSVAGITGSGEIVAFQQSTAASSNAEAAWTFYNITDDLNSQTGMTTPAFTQMTSYVTSWNQWTLAGLDANGNVQGVWVNVAQFTTWRVDNLSTITGADPLTGELDVPLTTWGGSSTIPTRTSARSPPPCSRSSGTSTRARSESARSPSSRTSTRPGS